MTKLVYTVILFSLSNSYCQQQEPILHGTIIMAAKCSDGIIVAADSRMNIDYVVNKKETSVAYFDNCQKIFIINKFVITSAGHYYTQNASLKSMFLKFCYSNNVSAQPSKFLKSFINWARSRCPKYYDYLIHSNDEIICCGYYESMNRVIIPEISVSLGDSVIVANTRVAKGGNSDILDKNYSITNSCEEDIKLAIKYISTPAIKTDDQHLYGGKVSVVKLSMNSISWLSDTTKFLYWNDEIAYIKDYLRNRIPVVITNQKLEQEIRKIYQKYINGELKPL